MSHCASMPALASAQPAQQLRYAMLLEWGTRLGLALLALSFAGYVTGLLPGHVEPERLSQLWSLPVGSYLGQTQTPTGWGWLALLPGGDALGLAGIAILAGCSALALLALVPMYAASSDRALAALCLLEALVVAVAASGWAV